MRITMHEISYQLVRDVRAIAAAAKALDQLAAYCAAPASQRVLFTYADEWEIHKQAYLDCRHRHEEEYEKLTILL